MNKIAWLPWSQLMSFGFGRLHLSSNEFWAMTLREIDTAIEGYFGERRKITPPSQSNIMSMMEKYPDTKMEKIK